MTHCSVKCVGGGTFSWCDSPLVGWCDIGCPTAVSRLMLWPKTDTLSSPTSCSSLPSLILQQTPLPLCNTLPLLMLKSGGNKSWKIGSFPTHHPAPPAAAEANCSFSFHSHESWSHITCFPLIILSTSRLLGASIKFGRVLVKLFE